MFIQENIPLGSKTTMHIGGCAEYYAELNSKEDIEEAYQFAHEKKIPLIVLGGGSNTVFADGVIEALVVRVKADRVVLRDAPPCHGAACHPEEEATKWLTSRRTTRLLLCHGSRRFAPHHDTKGGAPQDDTVVTVQSGKILASLINELAEKNLDLSPLTGIPGTVGGAIFGNAGQGSKGIWISLFVESIEVCIDGTWKTFTKEECEFGYRESVFKKFTYACHPELDEGRHACAMVRRAHHDTVLSPIIWSATLSVPHKPSPEIKTEIERLIQKRIETQPHIKTAGSCFKGVHDTPAWKCIDQAGLRGKKCGSVQIAEKHANFLLNTGKGTFEDAKNIVEMIQKAVPEKLDVEMRFIDEKGNVVF